MDLKNIFKWIQLPNTSMRQLPTSHPCEVKELNTEQKKVDKYNKELLQSHVAYSVPFSNRNPHGDFSILSMLTPERLYSILNNVKQGYLPAEYLELAEAIELRDLHYRSVLSTRKDAVCKLNIKVVPASEDKRDIEIADAVRRDIVENRTALIHKLIRNMLDALAKGFSVNEIIWKSESGRWMPKEYKFRPQTFFQYDFNSGRLCLRQEQGTELLELQENKFIVYEPNLVSSSQISSGLAFPALFYLMLKNYDVTSWAAFIDRFGYPIRLGKYGAKATEEDIKTLRRAVSAIGSDFGAIIPESAVIEIIESKTTQSTSDTYERMANWIDKQISKLILGQTMTADDGASRSQAQVHDNVREDIASSDIKQIIETINSSLTVPYVNFNFGNVKEYPNIELFKPDNKNIEQIIKAVEVLGDKGLTVKADEIREMLGLSKPEKTDDTVGGKLNVGGELNSQNSKQASSTVANPSLERLHTPHPVGVSLNSENKKDDNSMLDTSSTQTCGYNLDDDYIAIEDDIAETLKKALESSDNFETLQKELEYLASSWSVEKTAKLMTLAFFIARANGSANFDKDK